MNDYDLLRLAEDEYLKKVGGATSDATNVNVPTGMAAGAGAILAGRMLGTKKVANAVAQRSNPVILLLGQGKNNKAVYQISNANKAALAKDLGGSANANRIAKELKITTAEAADLIKDAKGKLKPIPKASVISGAANAASSLFSIGTNVAWLANRELGEGNNRTYADVFLGTSKEVPASVKGYPAFIQEKLSYKTFNPYAPNMADFGDFLNYPSRIAGYTAASLLNKDKKAYTDYVDNTRDVKARFAANAMVYNMMTPIYKDGEYNVLFGKNKAGELVPIYAKRDIIDGIPKWGFKRDKSDTNYMLEEELANMLDQNPPTTDVVMTALRADKDSMSRLKGQQTTVTNTTNTKQSSAPVQSKQNNNDVITKIEKGEIDLFAD